MSIARPQPVAAYFAGLDPFAEAATIEDEGQERRGRAAIGEWTKETARKYRVTVAVTDIAETHGKTVVTGRVSGSFPGSPVELRYAFTLAGEKISRLEILS